VAFQIIEHAYEETPMITEDGSFKHLRLPWWKTAELRIARNIIILPVQSTSSVLSWPMNMLFYSAFNGIVGTPVCNYELFKLNTYDVFPHKCEAHALMRGGFLKRVYAALTTGFHRRTALVPCRIQDASNLTGHNACYTVHHRTGG
jgi:hypothetical protein